MIRKKTEPSTIKRTEALKSTPVKNIEVTATRMENGGVLLTYPIGMRPWMTGIVRWLGGKPNRTQTKKIQLDTLGTDVWDQLDGKRSVKQVIKQFAKKHRLHQKEAEMSVTQFLRDLGKRGIIGIK